ncbi:MAG: hypothetical protein ACE5R7_08520, partial [Nitrosarchaeum sp.]
LKQRITALKNNYKLRLSAFAVTIKHSSFSHTLIMIFMITFVTSNQVTSLQIPVINTDGID